jgi:hypothetical protein
MGGKRQYKRITGTKAQNPENKTHKSIIKTLQITAEFVSKKWLPS